METQKTQNNQAMLSKNKAGGITIPNLKLYYKAIMVLAQQLTHRTIEEKRRHRYTLVQLQPSDSGKRSLNVGWRKDSLFNARQCENGIYTYRKLHLEPHLPLNELKCIKHLTIRT